MKKWNSLAVICIVLLLAIGYGIPSVVMAIEDNGRKSELKSFQIENIELNFQNVDIVEEMRIFPDMILNNIVVEMGDTSIEIQLDEREQSTLEDTQGEIEDKNKFRIENSINDFLNVLHPEHTIAFVDFKATYCVMMVSKEDERVYPVWECYGIDEAGREYRFWMDDLSGKVLAFEIPYEIIGVPDELFFEVIERLGSYYEASIVGLENSFLNVYKSNYWQNVLILMDEEGSVRNHLYLFKVEEQLFFNVYPGSVSIYERTHSEAE